jgi:hypothetical protein
MSRNGEAGPVPTGGWLEGEQRRAWLAYIRVQLRLAYEMNRQLLADSGMSLPDYDVLTALSMAAADRRVTEVTLTDRGRQALEQAAPGHVDLVRRLFFGGLPADLVGPLSEALESVYANIIKHGSLPPPVD